MLANESMMQNQSIGLLVVGGILQPSGSCIAEIKSKETADRQLSDGTSDISRCEDAASNVDAVETHYERGPRIKHVCRRAAVVFGAVSYTHLTLPTNREV